jgi:hypothetical protein
MSSDFDLELNPFFDDRFQQRVERSVYDNPTVKLAYLKEGSLRSYRRNFLSHTNTFKGIVLKVEEGFTGAASARERTPTEGSTPRELVIKETIRLRVRIPEIHAHIPLPCSGDTIDYAALQRGVVEMHPLFVARGPIAATERPQAGDIVEVSFYRGPEGGNQVDGIFHRVYQTTLGASDASACVCADTLGPAARAYKSGVAYAPPRANLASPRRSSDPALEQQLMQWRDEAIRVARLNNIPVNGFLALIAQESAWDPVAISPVGAVGLVQLMPATARQLGLRVDSSVDEREDPYKSLEAGARYISQTIPSELDSSTRRKLSGAGITRSNPNGGREYWDRVLSAYNAGSGTVNRAINNSGNGVFDWRENLPKDETRHYIHNLTPYFVGEMGSYDEAGAFFEQVGANSGYTATPSAPPTPSLSTDSELEEFTNSLGLNPSGRSQLISD